MNTRQKIGLGIVAPLFALSLGHTVMNKLDSNSENTVQNDTTALSPEQTKINMEKSLKNLSDTETSLFQAKQNLDNTADKLIKELNIDSAEAKEILENSVECGD